MLTLADFRVDPAVHDRHRDYVAVILLAERIGNGPSDGRSDQLLAGAEASYAAQALERPSDHPHLAAWRAAFSAFGAKPSRYPSSAEALAARVAKGQPLPRINVLVDLYNAISVRHLIPVGGEDADQARAPLTLAFARGDEPFDPRDDGAPVERADLGEAIWSDALGVTCRRWNWRQCRRTQLTEASTSAHFIFDRLAGCPLDELREAVDALRGELETRWPAARFGQAELSRARAD